MIIIQVLGIRCQVSGKLAECEPSSAHKGAGDRLRERVGGGGVSNYSDANEKIKT